jgi:hypothetical protein
MHTLWEGESPSGNLMEVKRREAQGRHREVGSEGSVDQRYEPTNRNWISRRQGGTSWHKVTKSVSINDRKRKSSGCVLKESVLTPGGLCCCLCEETGGTERLHMAVQESAEGIVPVWYGEGPNGVEWLSGVGSYG